MRKVLIILLIGFTIHCLAGVIPDNRLVEWSKAGYKGVKPEFETVYDFVEEGGIADGVTPNDAVMSNVMLKILSDPGIVYFPPGDYLFTQPITLESNCIIRGLSSQLTTLIFDLESPGDAIRIRGSVSNRRTVLESNALKNQDWIEVGSHSFNAGDIIYIVDNDSTKISSTYAYQSTGQLAKIDRIEGQTIYLDSKLRRNFTASANSRVVAINVKENVGIENLALRRLDESTSTQNILFQYTYNCWLKCVESYNCNYSHVRINFSYSNEVTGCYMQDGFDYGGGGAGYGLVIQYGSSECLARDNVFNHLRHSMILGLGANGNVLSYNYSINPYWTDPFLPSNSAGDLVLHGDYPYCNLFEGNTIQNIVIDDSHGKNGPYNTYFRNRAELYGIFMNNSTSATDSQTFVGNEITSSGFFQGLYSLAGQGHFQYGNNVKGSIRPTGTNSLSDTTLYMIKGMPLYFWDNSKWPPIGIPNVMDQYLIEAEASYNSGTLTKCSNEIVYTSLQSENRNVSMLEVYPNPFKNQLNVKLSKELDSGFSVFVYTMSGALVEQLSNQSTMDVSDLLKGVYVIQVMNVNGEVVMTKKVVKN